MSAAPHYGLRYGSAPATGDFQRLRGRPPLVSPLKSCMSRSFTAVTRVQIPSGTPSLFKNLRERRQFCAGTKRNIGNNYPIKVPCNVHVCKGLQVLVRGRSEERRVGKECRS